MWGPLKAWLNRSFPLVACVTAWHSLPWITDNAANHWQDYESVVYSAADRPLCIESSILDWMRILLAV